MATESALIAAVELVIAAAVSATGKITNFRTDLNRLKLILFSIKLAIDDIEHFNKILERPQYETDMFTLRLVEGEKLVHKCSKIKWNVFKRWYYSKKLSNFEALLLKFFQIDVMAHQVRESKRISVTLNGLEEKINEMNELMKKFKINTIDGVDPDGVTNIFLGFELKCQEEKEMLPEGGGTYCKKSA